MTPIEIESWALRIVEQVSRGDHGEDSRVELKATWPKPVQAARQIAAHANAARGTSILWIVGLDEQQGVTGAAYAELANWHSEVNSHFDGIAPDLYDLNIVVNEKTLVALLFETDRAPYVVKNSAYGQTGGGSVELEVPWREGRKTRSARRVDLIRLLEPLSHQPAMECLDCQVTVNEEKAQTGGVTYQWFVEMNLYVTPLTGTTVVIPFHRCKLELLAPNSWKLSEWTTLSLRPPSFMRYGGQDRGFHTKIDSLTIASSGSEVIIEGPGRLDVATHVHFDPAIDFKNQKLLVRVKLAYIGGHIPIIIEREVTPRDLKDNKSHYAQWAP